MAMAEVVLRHALVFGLAYLLGAFPTGFLLVRAFSGIDIRRIGSGRTGGTNVLRAAGPLPAALTVVVDALKGGLGVLVGHAIGGTPLALAIAGVATILGHNYSIFLGWDGGAGTMTMLGVALFIDPLVGGAAIILGLGILLVFRYASLASIVVAVAIPLLYAAGRIWGGRPAEYIVYAGIVGLISIYELRPNIMRLVAGTERKIDQRVQVSSGAQK